MGKSRKNRRNRNQAPPLDTMEHHNMPQTQDDDFDDDYPLSASMQPPEQPEHPEQNEQGRESEEETSASEGGWSDGSGQSSVDQILNQNDSQPDPSESMLGASMVDRQSYRFSPKKLGQIGNFLFVSTKSTRF